MKRLKIGAISALLVLGLLVGSAGAAGSGVLHEASLQLSGGLTLTGADLDQGAGAQAQVRTYTPGGAGAPRGGRLTPKYPTQNTRRRHSGAPVFCLLHISS